MEKQSRGAVQDTGNPVFDSVVNVLMNTHLDWTTEAIPNIHKSLLNIFEQEPKSQKLVNQEAAQEQWKAPK